MVWGKNAFFFPWTFSKQGIDKGTLSLVNVIWKCYSNLRLLNYRLRCMVSQCCLEPRDPSQRESAGTEEHWASLAKQRLETTDGSASKQLKEKSPTHKQKHSFQLSSLILSLISNLLLFLPLLYHKFIVLSNIKPDETTSRKPMAQCTSVKVCFLANSLFYCLVIYVRQSLSDIHLTLLEAWFPYLHDFTCFLGNYPSCKFKTEFRPSSLNSLLSPGSVL